MNSNVRCDWVRKLASANYSIIMFCSCSTLTGTVIQNKEALINDRLSFTNISGKFSIKTNYILQ